MGGYSYLVLARKQVELPCPVPLNSSFLENLGDETINNLDVKKLVKVDLPKIPDMDKKKLEGLGLKGANPKQIQTVSQMDKKELEKKLKEEKEKRGVDKEKIAKEAAKRNT
jgi:cobalamin biosynthesis protein CbiG